MQALTIAEVIFDGWTAGSVSLVIWTFRVFQSKFADEADVLADWVLSRTINEYLPYGTYTFGSRSLSELSLLRKASIDQREAVRNKELQRQRDAQSRPPEKASRDLTAQFDDVTSRQQRRSFLRAPIHEVHTKLASRPLI